MRRGEILGLRWQDVDLKAGTLAVRQCLKEPRAGLVFGKPKTPKSRRVITLTSLAVEALRRHKGEQAQQRLLQGPAYKDNGLVAAWPDGSPFRPHYVTLAFGRVAQKIGLPSKRLHD